jgi:hypothetical protein
MLTVNAKGYSLDRDRVLIVLEHPRPPVFFPDVHAFSFVLNFLLLL